MTESTSAETVRCFVAMEMAEGLRRRMAAAVRAAEVPGLRPTATQNLHVTVKFLGEVAEDRLPPFVEAVARVADDVEAFVLPYAGLVVRPDTRRPRLLAAAYGLPDVLATLQQRVEAAAAEWLAIKPEARAYRPHVTLGRFRFRRRPPRELGIERVQLHDADVRVERMALVISELLPEGPRYTVREGWEFVG